MSTPLPFGFYDLVETFPKSGCAVCNLLLRDTHQYMDSLLYEFVNKPDTHRKFRAGRGLCRPHGWQLKQYGSSVVGIAILCEATMDEVLKIMEANPIDANSALSRLRGNNGKSALADKLEPSGPCDVCKAMDAAEMRYTDTVARHIMDARLDNAYQQSDGLCLPHFRQTLRAADTPRAEKIATIQTTIWRKLKADLGEFVRKNLYQHAAEPITPDEGTSWQRAIGALGGEENMVDFPHRST